MCLLPKRLFKICLFFIVVAFSNASFGQRYDGPVGKNEIPQTYQGFQNDIAPLQGPVTSAPGEPCFGQDPADVICPIDSYLYVLLVLGVGYGYLKFGRKKVAVL